MGEQSPSASQGKLSLGTKAYLAAWRNAAKVPQPLALALANAAADVAWRRGGKGVKRLRSNLAKVRPDLSAAELNRLTRAAMRSYVRYFYEAFTLQTATPEQLQARVRMVGSQHIERVIDGETAAVLAIGHTANWDLAGSWASLNRNVAPVVAVAERLKPPELFEQFLEYRTTIGLDILPLGDPGVFQTLVERAKTENVVIALVADRDLTKRGVEVMLAGHPARVAAGPATVALAAGVDLIPVVLYYEKLTGERRRQAGYPWGVVLEAHAPVPRGTVPEMMQAWADVIGAGIQRHPADWHMLQRVFVEDLDPARLAAVTAAADATEG